MGFFDRFRGRKPSKRPHRLVFEAENPDNGYITFESKCKPRVHVEDSLPQEVYQALSAREGEMIQALEEIISRCYLDRDSPEPLSQVDSFPDIRYLTGNYYIACVSYFPTYRDRRGRYYQIKDGQFRNTSWAANEPRDIWLPLGSPEITRHYAILITAHLTRGEGAEEDDYMGLDVRAELDSPDEPLRFEILSHDVI